MLIFALAALSSELPLPAAPVMTAAAVARAFADLSADPKAAPERRAGVLEPDLHDTVDVPGYLAAQESLEDVEAVSNPFRRRFHPPAAGREIRFAVSAILTSHERTGGSCILNGAIAAVGELAEGLMIAAIDPDGVVLQGPGFQVRVPMQEHPVIVRLPR